MNLIVVVDQNWGIGCQGEQMVYLKEDLKRFKEITQGGTVILGRKTLATFPKQMPLPNRRNLILTHNSSLEIPNAEAFSDMNQLLQALPPNTEDVFVIGGGSVYQAFLPLCAKAFVTRVEAAFPVDCYFPNLEENPDWTLTEQSPTQTEQGVNFTYCSYENTKL